MISWLFQHAKYPQHNAQVIKIIRQHFNQIHLLTDSRACSLLHITAQYQNLDILKYMLDLYQEKPLEFTKGQWLSFTDNQGNTPLHYAAFKGSLPTVRLLQKNGANSLAVNKNGLTCLHFAAQGGSPLIMYYFKEKGLSVDCVDHNNNTPLHWAVYAGSDCAVAALLCWGATADLQQHNGDTALHVAVVFGSMKIISRLVTYGCDVTIKNKDGRTAYQLAVEGGYENIESYLQPKQRLCVQKSLCLSSTAGIRRISMYSISVFMLLMSLTINSVSVYIYSSTDLLGLIITCIVLGIVSFILLISLHYSDAGSIDSLKYDKNAYMKLLIENNPKIICFECEIEKPNRSKHCYECGRCIRVFDHHCSWVGNCIGTNNIMLFMLLLLCSFLYIFLTLISHAIGLATQKKYDYGELKIGMLVCSIISLIMSALVLLPILYLFIRHLRLTFKGITFYQSYKLRKARLINLDIMLKQKKKLANKPEPIDKNKSPSQDSSTHRRPLIHKNINPINQNAQKGCCLSARQILWKNKYVEQYGWNSNQSS